MKDWIFYPLMTLIAGAMVFFALNYGERQPIDPEDGYVIEGDLLQTLTPTPGTVLSFKGDSTNPIAYAVMSADYNDNKDISAGVFTVLGEEYFKAYAGENLTITVRARAAKRKPSDTFLISFLAPTAGRIKWQPFVPTEEFTDFVLTTKLGPFKPEKPEIYFGIWPDAKGDGRGIEVEKYEVRVSNPVKDD